MDKKTYYVAVDKNRTWRSIKSGTKNIAQTYICIHGDLRKKSTLELQKANALDKNMSKCPKNVVARRKQTHSQDKVQDEIQDADLFVLHLGFCDYSGCDSHSFQSISSMVKTSNSQSYSNSGIGSREYGKCIV